MDGDGTFRCRRCSTDLNITDRNCWRCGSLDLEDCRPEFVLSDAAQADQLGVESVLTAWPASLFKTVTS